MAGSESRVARLLPPKVNSSRMLLGICGKGLSNEFCADCPAIRANTVGVEFDANGVALIHCHQVDSENNRALLNVNRIPEAAVPADLRAIVIVDIARKGHEGLDALHAGMLDPALYVPLNTKFAAEQGQPATPCGFASLD